MKNSTYSVRSHAVSTAKKSHATIPAPAAKQELPPRRTAPVRGRTETGAPQNRPDRCRAHANAELAQLTLNPYASPARILPPETNDQLTYRRIERRTPGRAVPVSPLLPHQLTVPAKKRLRRNQKHRPAIPRQKPARSRKQQPVAPRKRRPPHRPPKHAQLVPEHRVLQLQRRDRRAPRKNANQPPRRQVNKEEQHHADPTDRPVRTSESEFPRPTRSTACAHGGPTTGKGVGFGASQRDRVLRTRRPAGVALDANSYGAGSGNSRATTGPWDVKTLL